MITEEQAAARLGTSYGSGTRYVAAERTSRDEGTGSGHRQASICIRHYDLHQYHDLYQRYITMLCLHLPSIPGIGQDECGP